MSDVLMSHPVPAGGEASGMLLSDSVASRGKSRRASKTAPDGKQRAAAPDDASISHV